MGRSAYGADHPGDRGGSGDLRCAVVCRGRGLGLRRTAVGPELVGACCRQLSGRFVAPHEAMLWRTIQAFDGELLDAVIWGVDSAAGRTSGLVKATPRDGPDAPVPAPSPAPPPRAAVMSPE